MLRETTRIKAGPLKARLARAALASLLSVCVAGSTAVAFASAEPLHLVTESYPPMNFEDNGTLKGVSVDLLKIVMADAGISYDMELMPWARAYTLAQNKADYCVFTTVHNTERDRQFRWVEPLLKGFAYLIKKKGANIHAQTIAEARHFLVGTQRGDYTEGLLQAQNFKRIDLSSEINLTLNKLLMGRIDLMPMAGQLVTEYQSEGQQIEPVVMLSADINGLACNKQVPQETIAKIQASLDKFIANGTQSIIFKTYGWVDYSNIK